MTQGGRGLGDGLGLGDGGGLGSGGGPGAGRGSGDEVRLDEVRLDEAVRLLERVADRLRVVGPRLAAREGEAAASQLRQIRAGLQRLADLAADADGEPRRPVPELAAHALGDQVLVLGHDALGHDAPGQVAPGQVALGHDVLGDQGPRSDQVRAAAVQALQDVNQLI